MRILELRAENIKKLKTVELKIDESQNVVTIAGRNGQGKTSLLDAIWYALGGKTSLPDMPIRAGESHASVTLDLGKYVITRSFTDKESYLKVENKEGAKFSSPQQMLDELVGQLSFDPLGFTKLPVREQRGLLLKLLNVDLTPIDAARKAAFDERTAVGRELKQLEGQLAGIPMESGAIPEPVDVAALAQKIADAKSDARTFIANQDTLKSIEKRILELKQEYAKAEADRVRLVGIQEVHTPQDIPALEKQLAEAESINTRVRTIEAYRKASDAVAAKKLAYDQLEAAIQEADNKKRIIFAEAKMPIEGLAVNDDGVLFRDIPFDQISAAEQLKVSLSIAMAANPEIRVIRILDGSLLDVENMRVVEEMAKQHDYQVWIERVDESGKVGIVIEDGEVKTA